MKTATKTKELETRTFTASELRFVPAADGKPPHVEGYAAVFNSPSEDLGGFTEIVLPGAFTNTLAAGADVRLLINHEGMPLARTASGTLTLKEDARGLWFSSDLDANDPDVQSLMPKMARKDVKECSFAFSTNADNWRNDNGKTIRELKDVSLADVSIVCYPAYTSTTVAMRSLAKFKEAEKATVTDPEKRVGVTVDDQCLIYRCRNAVQYCRYTFDALNCVLDELSDTDPTAMDDQDKEAADDLVSTLVDLIAKARRTKATLEATGAEDETEGDTDDDTPQAADESASNKPAGETASLSTDVQEDGEEDDDEENSRSAKPTVDANARARQLLAMAEVEA